MKKKKNDEILVKCLYIEDLLVTETVEMFEEFKHAF